MNDWSEEPQTNQQQLQEAQWRSYWGELVENSQGIHRKARHRVSLSLHFSPEYKGFSLVFIADMLMWSKPGLYHLGVTTMIPALCRWRLFKLENRVDASQSYAWNLQFSSVSQSCPTLCDPMDWSMPGLPVHRQLPEFTQTHVHWVGDAIQPSHPLLSPSPPAFNLSQHQGLFQWVSSSHQVAKVLKLQLQHQSFQWIFKTDFL